MIDRLLAALLSMALATAAVAEPLRLTTDPGDDRYPMFSPDGDRILFESNREGNWEVYTMAAGGGRVTRLTDHPAADRFAAWGPAGERIVFQSDRDGAPALFVLNLRDSRVEPLAARGGPEMLPHWSPDGSMIAYTSEQHGNVDLYLLRLGGQRSMGPPPAEPRRLTRHPRRDVWPRFSPDGGRLAFFSRRDTEGKDDEIYLLEIAGGDIRRVTSKPGHDFCPAFSPDGRLLVAASRDGDERFIAVFGLDGTLRHRLGRGFDRATHPSWSPDGQRIVFAGRRQDGYDLYALELPAELRPP